MESEDDYEVDNEYFVPHGYLSDEEIRDEEEMVVRITCPRIIIDIAYYASPASMFDFTLMVLGIAHCWSVPLTM